MNRRTFIRTLSAVSALAMLPIVGCAFSVTGALNVIINALKAIISYVAGSQPWAVALESALNALVQAEAAWKAGGAAAIIIDALNTIEAVLAVVPFTAIYSPLIDVIVSGIEAIINYFAPQTQVRYAKPRATAQNNPHLGRVALKAPGAFQSPAGSWKQQYNDTAIGVGLPQLKIA
ncbi:MAG TPA: hypothetical protein VMQ76_03545 [Terracidiphilus sp.]|jgi:hypothetical protein|nr:hypothetical protein [Terracidiphilus sp.]